MLDESEAMMELNASKEEASAEDLAAKYAVTRPDVDAELARLKAEIEG